MGGGKVEGTVESAVPRAAMDSLRETLASMEDVSANLGQFLSMSDPEVLAELPPLHRARAFLLLAKSVSTLFSVRLRCSGIHPDNHPVSKEFERLSLYEEKLERFDDWSKAPLRPSTKLNYQAATRFIGHSLPDLTPEQRKSMRDISRGNGARSRPSEQRRAKKKRRYESAEKPSARAAAQEFLEKAARELLSSSDCGLKGPLQNISDEDDE